MQIRQEQRKREREKASDKYQGRKESEWSEKERETEDRMMIRETSFRNKNYLQNYCAGIFSLDINTINEFL